VRCPYATAKAEAAAPKATEAAAPRSIAGTPTHGYEPRREAATAGQLKNSERARAPGFSLRTRLAPAHV
jgi:hypothetical protein